jgi:hypothetical protein
MYLYNDNFIISHAYNHSINSITRFINANNITSIQLSGDDVYRLKCNNIDIISDIKNKVLHTLNIRTTKKQISKCDYALM